jgi:hypothetical protein
MVIVLFTLHGICRRLPACSACSPAEDRGCIALGMILMTILRDFLNLNEDAEKRTKGLKFFQGQTFFHFRKWIDLPKKDMFIVPLEGFYSGRKL